MIEKRYFYSIPTTVAATNSCFTATYRKSVSSMVYSMVYSFFIFLLPYYMVELCYEEVLIFSNQARANSNMTGMDVMGKKIVSIHVQGGYRKGIDEWLDFRRGL